MTRKSAPTVPPTASFAEAFRAARDAEGITQEDMAHALGVSHRTIQHWEAGTKVPRLGVLYGRICPHFGWSWRLPFQVPDEDSATASKLGWPDWPTPRSTGSLALAGG